MSFYVIFDCITSLYVNIGRKKILNFKNTDEDPTPTHRPQDAICHRHAQKVSINDSVFQGTDTYRL